MIPRGKGYANLCHSYNTARGGEDVEMLIKLGTMNMKRRQTKEYESIDVGDQIKVLVDGKWVNVKIWKIHDMIPMRYFGEYL